MDTIRLKQHLKGTHHKLSDSITNWPENRFCDAPKDKWTAIQHLKHIHLSILPLIRLLSDKPRFIAKSLGMSDHSSRSFDAITQWFKSQIKTGMLSPPRYVPEAITFEERDIEVIAFNKSVDDLVAVIDLYTDTELEMYLIPHPILGNLTIREMMYFMDFHASHHMDHISNLEQNNINPITV